MALQNAAFVLGLKATEGILLKASHIKETKLDAGSLHSVCCCLELFVQFNFL